MIFTDTAVLEANFCERDLQILANTLKAGEDFDEAYYSVTNGYDDCDPVYYNRNAYKEEVRKYCETLATEPIYEVSIKLTNFTLVEAKEFIKKLEEGQTIELNSTEHELKKSNVKVRIESTAFDKEGNIIESF